MYVCAEQPYNFIPPSTADLIEHVKRDGFQSGHVWGQASQSTQQLLPPSNWGWKLEDGVWKPHKTYLSAIAACMCGCKRTHCIGNCKCYRSGLTCIV